MSPDWKVPMSPWRYLQNNPKPTVSCKEISTPWAFSVIIPSKTKREQNGNEKSGLLSPLVLTADAELSDEELQDAIEKYGDPEVYII